MKVIWRRQWFWYYTAKTVSVQNLSLWWKYQKTEDRSFSPFCDCTMPFPSIPSKLVSLMKKKTHRSHCLNEYIKDVGLFIRKQWHSYLEKNILIAKLLSQFTTVYRTFNILKISEEWNIYKELYCIHPTEKKVQKNYETEMPKWWIMEKFYILVSLGTALLLFNYCLFHSSPSVESDTILY